MPERYVSPCPPPTAFEAELLHIFEEECMEAGIRASKALRFGLAGQDFSNTERLAHEIGDLLAVIEKLLDWGIVDIIEIIHGKGMKVSQLARYMQQPPPRKLTVHHRVTIRKDLGASRSPDQ